MSNLGHSSPEDPSGLLGRVLLTGATGFIGFELAKLLVARGHDVRLMVRRPERAALLRPLNSELISADLTSPTSLRRAVEGIDTVFHLGARAVFESYPRLRPTIVDGSVSLMQAAAEAGSKRLVYASSLLVYNSQDEEIRAETPAIPRVDYGQAKLEAERKLQRMAESAGLQFAAVRLPHVYGASDLLFERIRRGLLLKIGSGDNLYSHLHVRDAARLLIAVAEKGWTGISAVGDERPTTWREFFAAVREHYPRFREIRVPSWLARLGTELMRPILALQSQPSLMTPDTVVGWNLRLPVARDLLWNQLGMRPRYATIDEGIPAALDDYLAFRWQHPLSDRSRY
jgi:nucleoside-diphosphate-sugar epimerase